MNTNDIPSLIGRFIPLSPAYPAFMLLFGMILAFAAADLIGIEWHSGITVALYVSALTWSLLLTWNRRRDLPQFNRFDLLLALFVFVILVSLLLHGRGTDLVTGYPRYLPFLLVAPYLSGRLMAQQDIELFARMLAYVGLAILPLLLWDAHTSPVPAGRHPFFGINHAPLLVGGLLAFALLAVGARNEIGEHTGHRLWRQTLQYALMAVIAGFMVWVSARGWVIGVVLGFLALLSGSFWNNGLRKIYFRRLVFVFVMIWLAFLAFPDSHYFYGRVLFDTPTRFTEQSELGPILGLASCRPIEAGTDSVAIRWVLYQEAVAQFIQAPLMGSGAGLFGERSCLGTGGFPHSTVLQGFSELGMVGGIALVTLLATAVITLFKMIAQEKNLAGNTHLLLALAFLAMYLVADQIYGNYFMASGTYFTLGVIAALHDRAKRKSLG